MPPTYWLNGKWVQLRNNADSTQAKKTLSATPNTSDMMETTIQSLTTRIDRLEKCVLELEGVL